MSDCAAQSSFLISRTVASSFYYPSYNKPGQIFHLTDLPFSIVGHSSKASKLVWPRPLPTFQVALVLFKQVFRNHNIAEGVIRKSTVKCTAGSIPIHTPATNWLASQTSLQREQIPVCQPSEGAVDIGPSSSPV